MIDDAKRSDETNVIENRKMWVKVMDNVRDIKSGEAKY
jgi:hypothetical protein